MEIDPNKTWKLLEERAKGETNPKLRSNLEVVIEHVKAEARADIPGLLRTLCDEPKYIWHTKRDDPMRNPEGSKEAIAAFYDRMVVQTGAHRLEWAIDRVIVDEYSVFTEGLLRSAVPGCTLLEMGIEVDSPDAYYVAEDRCGVVWPIDAATGLLKGEEIYTCSDELAGIEDRKISIEDIVAAVT